MDNRHNNIAIALDETCNWLFETKEYQNWINRVNIKDHKGLLWIKGKPGAGKSTLMKEAFRRTEKSMGGTSTTTAGFFFNARGTEQLEKTPLGLFRSVLHQVLQQDLRTLARLAVAYQRKKQFNRTLSWYRDELQNFLMETYTTADSRPSIIFIDALDECDENEVRDLIDFFRTLTTKAYKNGARLNVCLSSRHYPQISIENCPEVVMEDHNQADILRYISTAAANDKAISSLSILIFEKSSGVFLWAVLVVSMLKKLSSGRSVKWLRNKLLELPPQLETLFRSLFVTVETEDAPKSILLIQLILFAGRKFTQKEIHCAICFGRSAYPSIAAWKESDEYLETSEEQHQMIIELSRGLLEITPSEKDMETPSYQFIHESVRDFFLKGNGFALLGLRSKNLLGSGHSSITGMCINFLQL
jgi:AAA ATPase domain